MNDITSKTIGTSFMQLIRRSEKADRSRLVETFVEVGPLFPALLSQDHQIMFGRRGTGKTHALYYLEEHIYSQGGLPIYIDLSNIGSSGGIYSDSNISLSERATRLLVDTLANIHDGLLEFFVEKSEEFDLSKAGPLLDAFGNTMSQVKVVGTIEQETTDTAAIEAKDETNDSLKFSPKSLELSISGKTSEQFKTESSRKIKESGQTRHSVHFGSVRYTLEQIVNLIHPQRVWILLDEWSSIPLDLQPYLADLLRRSIFSIRAITVKIAAIEYRSDFYLEGERGEYTGIELGADASAGINLDDYMVFDNSADRARAFYKELFFKHTCATDEMQSLGSKPTDPDHLIRLGFTQIRTFDELVRAAEGVPRDAINIIISAAQSAHPNPISVLDVHKAARTWYQRDKESSIRTNENALDLLHWIINQVIGHRKARAFLLRSNVRHPLIERLFDARLLHILKKNISSRDEPGIRYDVYKLDYGCYVDLMNTTGAPQGLLPSDNPSSFFEVPPDDYRSIRRAILHLQEFENEVH